MLLKHSRPLCGLRAYMWRFLEEVNDDPILKGCLSESPKVYLPLYLEGRDQIVELGPGEGTSTSPCAVRQKLKRASRHLHLWMPQPMLFHIE